VPFTRFLTHYSYDVCVCLSSVSDGCTVAKRCEIGPAASCAATFSWWKRLGPTSTERPATTGNGHLPLASTSPDQQSAATPGIWFPGVHHRRLFVFSQPSTTPLALGLPGTDRGGDPPPYRE